jgi:hypothetical protein
MLNHPVFPAILLALAGWRLFAGTATWVTAVSAAAAALWLASAWKEWQSKRDADDTRSGDDLRSPPQMPPASSTPPSALTPEQLRALRGVVEDNRRNRDTPTLPSEEEIRATAEPAIALLRASLPQPLDGPARSYLGGLPRLPPGVPWPEIEKYERFALTFLAQIDLSELPAAASALPRAGTLYFFADTNDDCPEPGDCRVIFHPGDASGFPPCDLPATARRYGDDGEPWPWLPESSVWARAGFRFPLEFAAFDSVRDYVVEEGANSPPRRNRDACERMMAEEYARRLNRRALPPRDAWREFEREGDDWPFAWVAIEFAARSMARSAGEALGRRESEPAHDALRGIAEAATQWVERAARESPSARCPDDVRQAFVAEWRGWDATFEDLGRRSGLYVRSHHDRIDVLAAACFVCAASGAADAIPAPYRLALEHMADPGIGFPEHQMLGHGEKVQWAPIEHAAQRLLLQLTGDRALGWHANSGCALQFWIEPEALERADFGSVQMTLECD